MPVHTKLLPANLALISYMTLLLPWTITMQPLCNKCTCINRLTVFNFISFIDKQWQSQEIKRLFNMWRGEKLLNTAMIVARETGEADI